MKHTGSWICICLVFSTFYLTIPPISISYNLSKSKCSFNTSSSFDSRFAIFVHNLSIYFPNYEECSSLRMHFCGFLPLERIIYWIWYLQQHLCDLGQSFTRNQIHQKCQNMTRRELQWSYISSYDFTSPSQWSLFFQHMLLYSFSSPLQSSSFFPRKPSFLHQRLTLVLSIHHDSLFSKKKICSEAAVPDWSTRTFAHKDKVLPCELPFFKLHRKTRQQTLSANILPHLRCFISEHRRFWRIHWHIHIEAFASTPPLWLIHFVLLLYIHFDTSTLSARYHPAKSQLVVQMDFLCLPLIRLWLASQQLPLRAHLSKNKIASRTCSASRHGRGFLLRHFLFPFVGKPKWFGDEGLQRGMQQPLGVAVLWSRSERGRHVRLIM